MISSGPNFINVQIPDNSNKIIINLNLNGTSNVITLNYLIGANSWYNLAIVFSENLINNIYITYFYINGKLISTVNSIPIIINTANKTNLSNIYTNNFVGLNNASGSLPPNMLNNSFIGGLSDLRFYRRSLSSSEINQLYFYNLYVNNSNTNYSLAPYVGNMSRSYSDTVPNAYQLLSFDSSLVIFYTFQSLSNNYMLNSATDFYDGLLSIPTNNSNNYNFTSDMINNNLYVLNNSSLYSNGYNYLINSIPFLINNGITICFWLCINSFNPNVKNKIFSILYNNSTSELYLYFDGKNLRFNNNNSEASITGNIGLMLNTWYFISISSDTSSINYLNINNNAVVQLTLPFPNTIYNSITLFGDAFGYNVINAFLNDFRVYNRKLSQSDLSILYNYGVTFKSYNLDTDTSLVSYFTFASSNVSNLVINNNITNANTSIVSNNGMINPTPMTNKKATGNPPINNGWVLVAQNQSITLNSNNINYLNYLPNNVNKSGTIAFWFYYSSASTIGSIISLCSSNSYINVQLINTNNNINLSIRTLNSSNGGAFVENKLLNNNLVANTWYHFALVCNRAIDHNHQSVLISNYYINGVFVSSGDASIFPASDLRINNYIGAYSGSGAMAGLNVNGYAGGFTDLRIFIRGLSSSEVNQIYYKP